MRGWAGHHFEPGNPGRPVGAKDHPDTIRKRRCDVEKMREWCAFIRRKKAWFAELRRTDPDNVALPENRIPTTTHHRREEPERRNKYQMW